ncbi:MAG: hypothetical protein WDO18_13915 [Acidobacteriota bacterium]
MFRQVRIVRVEESHEFAAHGPQGRIARRSFPAIGLVDHPDAGVVKTTGDGGRRVLRPIVDDD